MFDVRRPGRDAFLTPHVAGVMVALCLGWAWPVLADEPAPPTFSSVVESSVLTGSGAGARQEIGPAELEQKGASTLGEALAGETGLRVDTSPVAGSANAKQELLLSLRGFDPADVLVLVDGAPVADPDSGLVDLARYSLDGVQRIVVSRGCSSLLYGPGALAGVVHLVTGPPGAREGSALLRGEAFNPLGGLRLSGAAGGGLGNTLSGHLAGSFVHSPGFPVPADFVVQRNENGGVREASDVQDASARGRVEWNLPGVSFQAGGSFADHDGGVPFSIDDPAPSELWRRGWRRESADLGAELQPIGPFDLRAKAYLAHQLDTITSYTDASFDHVMDGGEAISTHDGLRLGLFLAPRLKFPATHTELTLGYHHQVDLASRQDERGEAWQDFRTETVSLALEGRWRPLPRFSVLGGVSGVGFYKEKAAGGPTGDDVQDAEWQLGTEGSPAEGLLLRAGASRRVGFPTLKRLYGTYGNPDLRPQRALLLDAGAELTPRGPWRLGGELSLFHDRVTDLISQGGTANEMVYENVDQARLQGVELTVHATPVAWLDLDAGWSWLDARDESGGRRLDTLDYRPAHTLDAGAQLGLPWRGGSFGLHYHLVSDRSYEVDPGGAAAGPGAPPEDAQIVTLPWYGLLDLRVAQRFDLGPTASLQLYLRVANAGDTYREDAPGRPGPGRVITIGAVGEI